MTLVRLQDAGRQYGDRWVIRHVGFHVAQGERWGSWGRNGIGKTTLLRLITCEDEPTEGEGPAQHRVARGVPEGSRQLLGYGRVDYRAEGTVDVRTPIGMREVPFHKTGTFMMSGVR